jgi:hypothetical protein
VDRALHSLPAVEGAMFLRRGFAAILLASSGPFDFAQGKLIARSTGGAVALG